MSDDKTKDVSKTLTAGQWGHLSHALSCRLDDYEKEIKKEEKKQGKQLDAARKHWAELARIKVALDPGCLCGDWQLLDGTVITKQGAI